MNGSAEERLLFAFGNPEAAAAWSAVNDNVMGGVSEGGLRPTDHGTALFSGKISLENGGGFSSVQSKAGAYELSRFGGIALRVRGDGKHYKLYLRTDAHFDGVIYQAGFDTLKDAWVEPFLAFRDFIPTHHGREVEKAGPLDAGQIRSFGLLIADAQAGPFGLEVEWIRAQGAF